MKKMRTIAALLLTLIMAVSSVWAGFAEGTNPPPTESGQDTGNPESVNGNGGPDSVLVNGQGTTVNIPIIVVDGTAYYVIQQTGNTGDTIGSSEVDGDLAVSENPVALAVHGGGNQHDPDFAVTGTVSDTVEAVSQNTSGVSATAVYVMDSNGISSDDATVTVGSANAEATQHQGNGENIADAIAVDATASGKGESVTVVIGNDADGEKHHATATARAEGSDSDAFARTVVLIVQRGGAGTVTVYGDAAANAAPANDSQGNTGSLSKASAVAVEASAVATDSTAEVHVTGQAKASAEAGENGSTQTTAVFGRADNGGKTTVTVEKGALGTVETYATGGGTTTVNILDGGIMDNTPDDSTEGALYAESTSGGTVIVNVEDDGISTANDRAVWTENKGGSIELDLHGPIDAKSDRKAEGVYATSKGNATTEIQIEGESVQATVLSVGEGGERRKYSTDGPALLGEGSESEGTEAEKTTAIALGIVNSGGTINVDAEADFFAKGADQSIGVQLVSEEPESVTEAESITNLSIVGDVTADQIGLDLMISDDQKANILVDGTVSGGDAAIVLRGDTEIGGQVQVTVWEVVPNGDKALIVKEEKDEEGNVSLAEDYESEKKIQYIIRIEDSSAFYLSEQGTTNINAENGEAYSVAKEGDTVTVKLSIPSDKELVGAYWNENQTDDGKLLFDAITGEYYLIVPRGGGVILSVVLKDSPITEKKEAESESAANRGGDDDQQAITPASMPLMMNPDHINGYLYANGQTQTGVTITRRELTVASATVFQANMPKGWKEAFSCVLAVDGQTVYTQKIGKIVIEIPKAYRKDGRKFALLGMDKNGKVIFFEDKDTNPNTISVNLDLEGYEFMLIFMD